MRLMSSLWKRSRRQLCFRVVAIAVAAALLTAGLAAAPAAPAHAAPAAPADSPIPITYSGGDLVVSVDVPSLSPAEMTSFFTTSWPEALGLSPGASVSALLQGNWEETQSVSEGMPEPPNFSGGSITATASSDGSTVTIDIPASAIEPYANLNPILAGFIAGVAGAAAAAVGFGLCWLFFASTTAGLGAFLCNAIAIFAWTFAASVSYITLTGTPISEISSQTWGRILVQSLSGALVGGTLFWLGPATGKVIAWVLTKVALGLKAALNGLVKVFGATVGILSRIYQAVFGRAAVEAPIEMASVEKELGWATPVASGTVTSGYAGDCADAYHTNAADWPVAVAGQMVAINTCNGNPAQDWTVYSNGMVSVWGLCLDTGGGTSPSGDTLVDLEQCDGSSSQDWSQNGAALVSQANGECLDDPGRVTTPGTQLIVYPCNGEQNQQWYLPAASAAAPSGGPCDIYAFYDSPCVTAYSMDRALYSDYDGPLYQVQRASDGQTSDIGLLSVGGDVDANEQDSFCAGTTCTVTEIYDQSPLGNNLTIEQGGGADHTPDQGADAAAIQVKVGGQEAYGLDIEQGTGYRDDDTLGIATGGEDEGMYMVASGTHVNSGCCFDFGNVEADNDDNGAGHMDAVNLTTWCGGNSGTCPGDGPWVEADMENGQWMGNGPNPGDTGNGSSYVTAMLKNNGQSTFELEGGNSQSGGLTSWYDGALPAGYQPMDQEGGIVLGTGGDNSNSDIGTFFEGVMTDGFPSDAADAAVQANIVAAGYSGGTNPAGFTGPDSDATASAAGQAVVHQGYTSVFTVDSANGHLQETFLPAMFQSWHTHDLSSTAATMPDTPPVMAGTEPVAVTHCGYTSVFTVDASSGDLQESYLPAVGDSWSTQDLSANYHTPPTDVTPTAVVHSAGAGAGSNGCGVYTSVYTRDRNGDLEETYLPNQGFPGDSWHAQDLSGTGGTLASTPPIEPGTSPVAVVHCGYTSVYTVDATGHHLQETYLPAIGDGWSTQDLSNNYQTPPTAVTPTAVVHSAGAGAGSNGCDVYTSVYTVDEGSQHLEETYLPNQGFPGDSWHAQDLSANYQTPAVAPGTAPQALVHMGYTSVYTVDEGSMHLEETYLDTIGDRWRAQDLTSNYKAPVTDQSPIVLLHPDASGNLDWTSVFTVDEFTDDLWETYLPNTGFPGDAWVSQDLSGTGGTLPGTPPVTVSNSSNPASWSVAHGGYTSVYTLDSKGGLQETYLPAMGDSWTNQDLSGTGGTLAGTPAANFLTRPVALVHDGYTSVYTVDAGDSSHAAGDLQETYLPAVGDGWVTQDLSKMAGTPPVAAGSSPAAVFHDGYTSVYTVAANGDLWETYLAVLGGPWHSQDLSANYSTPKVAADTSPAAIEHDGFTSVYTVDAGKVGGGDLQETYLPVMGGGWNTQDLSENYQTPEVRPETSPTAVFHDGYVSVYTVDADLARPSSNVDGAGAWGDLQETYLPAIGDNWVTQDLSATYDVPDALGGSSPAALYHTGFTSVYYSDWNTDYLDEAYVPAISDAWGWNNLHSADPSALAMEPSPLLHYDTDGGLTWTSVYTIDSGGSQTNHLQETYLPAIGDNWTSQDLTAENPPGTPPW